MNKLHHYNQWNTNFLLTRYNRFANASLCTFFRSKIEDSHSEIIGKPRDYNDYSALCRIATRKSIFEAYVISKDTDQSTKQHNLLITLICYTSIYSILIRFSKRIANALTSLRIRAGWSGPTCPGKRTFTRRDSICNLFYPLVWNVPEPLLLMCYARKGSYTR